MIGAGVLGASIAARLAAAGMSVTLLDQDEPGRGTSRWSFAWVNSNDKGPKPYHDLNHAGLRAWAELAPGLDGTAWYRPAGNLELATSTSGRAELAARVRRLTGWGYPACLVDAAEAAGLEPALLPPGPDAAAAWFPGEAYLLTEPLIERLVARAADRGATVLTGDRGRVTGLAPGQVRTATGQLLSADKMVLRGPLDVPAHGPGQPHLPGPAGRLGYPRVACAGAGRPGRPRHPGGADPGAARPRGFPAAPFRRDAAPGSAGHTRGPAHPRGRAAQPGRRAAAPGPARGPRSRPGAHRHVPGMRAPAARRRPVHRRPPARRRWLYVAVTHSGVTLAAHLSRLIAAELAAGAASAEFAPYRPDRFAGTTVPITGPATGR